MIARYAYAIVTGTAITLALLYAMDRLIALQPGAETEPRLRATLEFVRLKEDTELRTTEPPPASRKFVESPATPPRPDLDRGDELIIDVGRPEPDTPADRPTDVDVRLSDGPLVAIVRVQPAYPAGLAQRGVEGWVIVQFDVLANGTVANVTVVDSSHAGFERAASKAAYRFRYKARVVDGLALPTTGIQSLFRFELEQ